MNGLGETEVRERERRRSGGIEMKGQKNVGVKMQPVVAVLSKDAERVHRNVVLGGGCVDGVGME